jgi:S1-C subfamily serine protease
MDRKVTLKTALLIGVVLTVVTFGVLSATGWSVIAVDGGKDVTALTVETARSKPLAQSTVSTNSFTEVYYEVSPSVVSVQVSMVSRNRLVGSGSGSGFVVDTAGHIVTNNHVVDGVTDIEVEFFDGLLASAEVVGVDPDSDLAVLKVDVPSERLHPVTFGDSDSLDVGQPVLAIGSPFGQNWTLTSGIISALNRTIQGDTTFSIGGVIQTDAAINPGNSGGPLLDLNGNVIGVNSQILSSSRSSSGIGFAIPSNLTQRVMNDLIASGEVDYSYLGISGDDVSMSLLEALDLPGDTRGVAVYEVTPGGPASDAQLQNATEVSLVNGRTVPTRLDIITAVDGYPVKGMGDLVSYLARETAPGQNIRLTVLRNGDTWIDIDVLLASRP